MRINTINSLNQFREKYLEVVAAQQKVELCSLSCYRSFPSR
jgi:hypothetical protein